MSRDKSKKIAKEIPEKEGWGARIDEIMRKNHLGQKEFAESLGFNSGGFISEAIQERKMPGGKFFAALKKEYGVSIDWLLSGVSGDYSSEGISAAVRLCHKNLLDPDFDINEKGNLVATIAALKTKGLSDAEIQALPALRLAKKR